MNKSVERLSQYDSVIKEHHQTCIIEKVANLEQLKNYKKKVSFLGHMSVFRDNVESTKCRIAYLSNLFENGKEGALSHNQISLPGPNLNNKLEISTVLKFNKY